MNDLAEILKILKSEHARLTTELENNKVVVVPADERREGSPFGKREEEADEAQELEKRIAMEKHLSEALAEITHALDKIKSGTYGICDSCGDKIEPARLEALPYAHLCLSCKTKQKKDPKLRLAH